MVHTDGDGRMCVSAVNDKGMIVSTISASGPETVCEEMLKIPSITIKAFKFRI